MSLPITRFNSAVLRQKGLPANPADPALRALAAEMIETMHAAKGIGLAAQQVGRALQMCVVEVPADLDVDKEGNRLNPDLAMPMVVLNPVITGATKETWVYEEGCLSFPEIHGKITRPVGIQMTYQDLECKTHTIEAKGLVGRCLQHEIDHLNGVLYIDKLTSPENIWTEEEFEAMRQEREKAKGAESEHEPMVGD